MKWISLCSTIKLRYIQPGRSKISTRTSLQYRLDGQLGQTKWLSKTSYKSNKAIGLLEKSRWHYSEFYNIYCPGSKLKSNFIQKVMTSHHCHLLATYFRLQFLLSKQNMNPSCTVEYIKLYKISMKDVHKILSNKECSLSNIMENKSTQLNYLRNLT